MTPPSPRACELDTDVAAMLAGSATGGRPWFHSDWLHRLSAASRMIRASSIGVLARLELLLLAGHKDPGVIRSIRAIRGGRESLLSGNEAFTLFGVARAQSALDGAMAEVGVFQGCSARIISVASGGCPLHLFDTFTGLPEPGRRERSRHRRGDYAASLPSVRAFLMDRPDVRYHQGIFPASAQAATEERFSLVHLDVDLKTSTRHCLEFFYPRMLPGGIILTHDYSYLDGVKEAFDEFLRSRPERVLELAGSQAMMVKR